jgi:hypothetical protein
VSWLQKAVCHNDKNSNYWLSYELNKIEYAKNGCAKCTVKKQCLLNSDISDKETAGVIAGISEYERKLKLWKKVNDINGNNWE